MYPSRKMLKPTAVSVGKHIPPKEIPYETGYPRTDKGWQLKKEEMIRDENDKHVCTSTEEPLKKKDMFRY